MVRSVQPSLVPRAVLQLAHADPLVHGGHGAAGCALFVGSAEQLDRIVSTWASSVVDSVKYTGLP
jgi:hypothetical protein